MNAYIYINEKNQVISSSSGGAFRKIVEQYIGGCSKFSVYGAIWNGKNEVVHSRIVALEDLPLLSGSKYSKSRMGDSFGNVKNDLKENRRVVFSGTPCQVAGLKQYLTMKKVDMTNLLLIDIICHGTPSPVMLTEWKSWIEKKYKRKINKINFRDKKIAWKGYPTTIELEGLSLSHTYDTQQFVRLFFSHLVLEECCYDCKYSNMERVSDITIGDFWGSEALFPDLDTKQGASLILTNSEKGMDILHTMKRFFSKKEVLEECMNNDYINYQQNLRSPTDRPLLCDEFWDDYFNNGYSYVLNKYGMSSIVNRIKFIIKKLLSYMKLYNKPF